MLPVGPHDPGHALVQKNLVPMYLRASLFLSNWDEEGSAWIPMKFMKSDATVNNPLQMLHLLQTIRYWIVPTLPSSIFEYALEYPSICCEAVLGDFQNDFPELRKLLAVIEAPQEQRWTASLQQGSLQCVQYMFAHGLATNLGECCDIAAAAGSLDCLQYLSQQGCALTQETCNAAAGSGQLDCLKYLHKQGCEWGVKTCEISAANGHIACLEYAIRHGCHWNCRWNHLAACAAAENGHVAVVDFLCSRWGTHVPWLDSAAEYAARKGQIAVLQYLRSIGHVMGEHTAMRACQNGHLHCLKYLHEQGCPMTVSVAGISSLFGHLPCLKYAVEHGAQINDMVYEDAATKEIKEFIETVWSPFLIE